MSNEQDVDSRDQLKEDLADYIAQNMGKGVDVTQEQAALQEIIKEEKEEKK